MPERWTLSETTVAMPGGTVSIMAQLNDGETEFAVFFEATGATGPPSLLHRWVHFVPGCQRMPRPSTSLAWGTTATSIASPPSWFNSA